MTTPHATTSIALRLAMEETGCSVRQLADAIGDRSTSSVEAWRAGVRGLTLDALARFPAGVALRVLAHVEQQKRAEVDARRPSMPVERHVMRITSSVGDFARVAQDALADGVVDEHERIALRRCTVRVIEDATHAAMDVVRRGTR